MMRIESRCVGYFVFEAVSRWELSASAVPTRMACIWHANGSTVPRPDAPGDIERRSEVRCGVDSRLSSSGQESVSSLRKRTSRASA